jgi:hypothetical protein
VVIALAYLLGVEQDGFYKHLVFFHDAGLVAVVAVDPVMNAQLPGSKRFAHQVAGFAEIRIILGEIVHVESDSEGAAYNNNPQDYRQNG